MLGGLGFLMGPIIGSVLNYFMGYAIPLYIYGVVLFILLIMLRRTLPNENPK